MAIRNRSDQNSIPSQDSGIGSRILKFLSFLVRQIYCSKGGILIGRATGAGPAQELTLGAGLSITGTTLNVVSGGAASNAFGTFVVSGQSSVVAAAAPDSITLAAGSGMTITTNPVTKTITLSSSGSTLESLGLGTAGSLTTGWVSVGQHMLTPVPATGVVFFFNEGSTNPIAVSAPITTDLRVVTWQDKDGEIAIKADHPTFDGSEVISNKFFNNCQMDGPRFDGTIIIAATSTFSYETPTEATLHRNVLGLGATADVTFGTITGTWTGTAIPDAKIASAATWNNKQDALVSGTNIKTVNGNSLLGSGDLVISSGGLTNFTESVNSASPNTTTPVVRLLATNAATNVDVAIGAKGDGATLAQVPDGTTTGGNKRGPYATDWQKGRAAANQIALGSYSTIGGGQSNRTTANWSTIAGGDTNYCNGTFTVCGGGSNNTTGGSYSTIGGGTLNTTASSYTRQTIAGGSNNSTNGDNCTIAGGASNSASGSYSAIVGGLSNNCTAAYAVVLGGSNNMADGTLSMAGGQYASVRGIHGARAWATMTYGGTRGDGQAVEYGLGLITTDATQTEITCDKNAGTTLNRVYLPNNSIYCFSGMAVARSSAGDVRSWRFEGTIKRGANAAATALVGSITTAGENDAGAAAWVLDIDADTTNGTLRFRATGVAATTIRWGITLDTIQAHF